MANTLGLSLCFATILLAPLWLHQIFSDDAGLVAIGGGKITEAQIFGGGRGQQGYPLILFHSLAYSGVLGLHLMALAVYVAFTGNDTARLLVAVLTLSMLGCLLRLQWSHPWTGAEPTGLGEMPVPLLVGLIGVVAAGTLLDTSP